MMMMTMMMMMKHPHIIRKWACTLHSGASIRWPDRQELCKPTSMV